MKTVNCERERLGVGSLAGTDEGNLNNLSLLRNKKAVAGWNMEKSWGMDDVTVRSRQGR